jgi:ribosome-associated translation inhibitor RaiA
MSVDAPAVQVTVRHGHVPPGTVAYVREKVGHVLHLAPAPVLFARVTLSHDEAPDLQRPAIAKAALDVNGRPVRAHVAAATFPEAVDLLEARLRHGLEVLAEKRQARRHEPATVAPGSWRHGALPTDRPEWYPRPPEERELVRQKSFLLHERTVADAALDLDVLDQDWVVFTEATTGADAFLARVDDLHRLTMVGDRRPNGALDLDQPVEVVVGAPSLDVDTALRLLDELGDPAVFFRDGDTGRGRVVYRRYDGHYGTVTAEATTSAAPSTPAAGSTS